MGGAQRSASGTDRESLVTQIIEQADSLPISSVYSVDDNRLPYYSFDAIEHTGDPVKLKRVLEAVVEEAIDAAGLSDEEQQECALFIGSSSFEAAIDEYRYEMSAVKGREPPPITFSTYASVTRHLRNKFNFCGGEYSINTACTSSINALNLAAETIKSGRIKYAIVVGIEWFNKLTLYGFDSLQLLSREHYRPFDKERDGLILGEGVAAVILGRKDADEVRAHCWKGVEFLSGSNNCDPAGMTCSSAESMKRAMVDALSNASLLPNDINLIKAHGTGTVGNDVAEASAMVSLFADAVPDFTILKPYLGHTLGASGVLEMVVLIELLLEGVVPATAGFKNYDSELGCRPIDVHGSFESGNVMFNYFGFGGNNSSTILSLKM